MAGTALPQPRRWLVLTLSYFVLSSSPLAFAQDYGDRPVRHPLQAWRSTIVSGGARSESEGEGDKVPLYETKDDPSGMRYAIYAAAGGRNEVTKKEAEAKGGAAVSKMDWTDAGVMKLKRGKLSSARKEQLKRAKEGAKSGEAAVKTAGLSDENQAMMATVLSTSDGPAMMTETEASRKIEQETGKIMRTHLREGKGGEVMNVLISLKDPESSSNGSKGRYWHSEIEWAIGKGHIQKDGDIPQHYERLFKQEEERVAKLVRPFADRLKTKHGAKVTGLYRSTPVVSARVPAVAIPAIANEPAVEEIFRDTEESQTEGFDLLGNIVSSLRSEREESRSSGGRSRGARLAREIVGALTTAQLSELTDLLRAERAQRSKGFLDVDGILAPLKDILMDDDDDTPIDAKDDDEPAAEDVSEDASTDADEDKQEVGKEDIKLTRKAKNVPREVPRAKSGEVAEELVSRERCAPGDVRSGANHQLQHFIDAGFDGSGSFRNAQHVPIAIMEIGGIREEHPVFASSRSEEGEARKIHLFDCAEADSCEVVTGFEEAIEDPHATGVAGNAAGFYSSDAVNSGSAPGSEIYFFRTAGLPSATPLVLDVLAELLAKGKCPMVINGSFGTNPAEIPKDCSGTHAEDRLYNRFFKMGVLFVKSAGNGGHECDARDCACTTTRPAGHTIFSVGSLGPDSDKDKFGPRCQSKEMRAYSSRGDGPNRSVVDISAQGAFSSMPDLYDSFDFSAGGTSFAAPVVAGAMTTFLDMAWNYKGENGDNNSTEERAPANGTTTDAGGLFGVKNFWTDPGTLYTAFLLMGDGRSGERGELQMKNGFSPLWGAGVLNMRLWTSDGMDSPWQVMMGKTCIDHGEQFTLEINEGKKISEDVDIFKAVAYWFDENHEMPDLQAADIDMELVDVDDNDSVIETSAHPYTENKERLFACVKNKTVALRLMGFEVPSDRHDPTCGKGSQLVYYGFMFEDNDRDDLDGPHITDVKPEKSC